MVVYICLDCGCLFSEPKHYVETHGLDGPPYEEWDGCPSCGGTYVETYKCDGCSNWIEDSYVQLNDGDKFCSKCYKIMEIGE